VDSFSESHDEWSAADEQSKLLVSWLAREHVRGRARRSIVESDCSNRGRRQILWCRRRKWGSLPEYRLPQSPPLFQLRCGRCSSGSGRTTTSALQNMGECDWKGADLRGLHLGLGVSDALRLGRPLVWTRKGMQHRNRSRIRHVCLSVFAVLLQEFPCSPLGTLSWSGSDAFKFVEFLDAAAVTCPGSSAQ
jgi:hypothetical protein